MIRTISLHLSLTPTVAKYRIEGTDRLNHVVQLREIPNWPNFCWLSPFQTVITWQRNSQPLDPYQSEASASELRISIIILKIASRISFRSVGAQYHHIFPTSSDHEKDNKNQIASKRYLLQDLSFSVFVRGQLQGFFQH